MKQLKLFAVAAALTVTSFALTSCGEDKKIAAEALKAIPNNAYKQVDSSLSLYGSIMVSTSSGKVEVLIDWTGTPIERWTFADRNDEGRIVATPTLPNKANNEEAVAFTLTATAKYNGAKATKKFEGSLMPVVNNSFTVAEAKNQAIDTEMSIRGVAVNAHADGSGFFVVDKTGALYVYDKAASHKTLNIYGKEVIVKGKRAINSKPIKDSSGNLLESVAIAQMTYDSVDVVSSSNVDVALDSAVSTTIEALASWEKDPTKEGFENHGNEIYRVEGKVTTYGSYTPPTWEVMDANNKYVSFYANTYNNASEGYDTELADFKDKNCVVYLVVLDINTSKSNKTSWRFVPLKVELAA